MSKGLWKAWPAIIFVLLAQSAFAQKASVIYGEDNRKDYFEVEEAIWRTRADSTVALIRASNLENRGAMTLINTIPYGRDLALCPSEPFYAQEKAAFCSGFLVSEDTVVSAGHCIRTQASCDSTKFVFGFRIEQAGMLPREVPSENVFHCRELIHSVAIPSGEDFSVVKLDRAVTFVSPLSFRNHGRPGVGENLMVIGHPAGLPLKAAGGASVRSLQNGFLVANLDTYGGNSGSAVFNAVSGEVEGILVRGELDYILQDGCRISKRCLDSGCRGEDVTLFENVLPYLSLTH